MKQVLVRGALLLTCLQVVSSCGGTAPADLIDPAADLRRQDYLELRHRKDNAPKQPMAAQVPPVSKKTNPVPFADVPLPGHTKLVSVTLTDTMPLRDVLVDLAREAKVNLELDARVQGGVIFSAHNQPFDDVLRRICALAGLRLKADGAYIRIERDDPYQETYQLDYLSLSRHATSETSIATNVFDVDVTSANGSSTSSRGSGQGIQNNSTSKVSGSSDADFWGEVEKSLTQILSTTKRKVDGDAKPNFSLDRQSGMITVYADSIQHAVIKDYVQKLKRKAYAQVLIDARIIEVELSDTYQSGVNWRTLFNGTTNAAARFGTAATGAPFSTATTATDGVFTAALNSRDFSGIINFVQGFGATRVLSAPRLTVLNNQTAVLKVATNQVYFVTQAQFTTVTNANGSTVTTTPIYTSTPRTVPVGLVMTVQPAIDADHDRVTMTLRPTISRVVDQVDDPSIGLNAAQAGVTSSVASQIPVLAVREMDSVIQLHSGEVAIMGGLMQDSSINNDTGIPGLDTLPIVGNLAKSRDNQGRTTELVILLRAVIADDSSPDSADAALYHRYNNDPRPLPLPDPNPDLSNSADDGVPDIQDEMAKPSKPKKSTGHIPVTEEMKIETTPVPDLAIPPIPSSTF